MLAGCLGRSGGKVAAGGGCWTPGCGGPRPDLTPSPPTLRSPLRSGLRSSLADGAVFEAGAGGGVVPGEIQADSAGHDGGDARGRRPLHVGAVLVLPSPFCLSPLLVSGRKPKSIRIGRQRRPWRRLLHEGAALGEFWGDGESAPLVGVRRLRGWRLFRLPPLQLCHQQSRAVHLLLLVCSSSQCQGSSC